MCRSLGKTSDTFSHENMKEDVTAERGFENIILAHICEACCVKIFVHLQCLLIDKATQII